MNKRIKKITTLFMLLLLVIATIMLMQGQVWATSSSSNDLADGEYELDFTFLKKGTDTASTMGNYTKKPAKLTVEGGSYYVELTLTESSMIQYLKLGTDETGQDVDLISTNEEKDERTVGFQVDSISEKIDFYTHVIVPPIPNIFPGYDSKYQVQLKFDLDSLVEVGEPTEPEEPSEPVLADGKYTINFQALHATEDKASSMDGWLLKPASLIVEDGKNYVYLTIQEKPGQFLTDIRLEKAGEFVSEEIVSENEETLQRVSKFEVPQLSIVNAEVDMHVVAANYQNTQKFRIAFDVDSIVEVLEVRLEDGKAIFPELTKSTQILTEYEGTPIKIVVPAGSNSITVTSLVEESDSLTLEISVGNLQDQTVKLTLPLPEQLAENEAGAFHQNGDIWEYREATVYGNELTFETELSAVKIAKAVPVPTLSVEVSKNEIALKWDEVPGATYTLVREYNNVETIVASELEGVSYKDTVDYEHSYSYKVRATSETGYQSAWSNAVVVTVDSEETPDNHNPNPAPTNPSDELFTIDFTVLQDKTNNISIMDEYTWKPAELRVKDGKNYISLTLLNSSWIKEFKVQGSTARVVSENKKANTRVIQFEVPNLSKKVTATTHVVIPESEFPGGGTYDNRYTVQIEFDLASKKPLRGTLPMPTIPNNPAPAPTKAIKGSEGGTIESNGAIIVVPAGAFASDFNVKVEKVSNPLSLPLDKPYFLASDVLEITKDKAGNFKKAITLTLPFDKTKVDLKKHELGIYWFNETTKKWVKLDNIQVDYDAGKVSGEVEHFTKFAVLAIEKKVEVVPQKPQEPTVSFKDLENHWAEEHIYSLVQLRAINGYPSGEFKPDNTITRAEFATILVKAFDLQLITGTKFADTANHWATDYITTAEANGIILGYSEDVFGPDDLLTRQQMAVMIVRAKELQRNVVPLSFKDRDKIAAWAKDAVGAAVGAGIINGYPDQTFRPEGNTTRAEAATVVVKAIQ